ncbi:MAG TPA: hypothetical protein VI322_05105, partial [Candidatus Saccharimonadia bacterium]
MAKRKQQRQLGNSWIRFSGKVWSAGLVQQRPTVSVLLGAVLMLSVVAVGMKFWGAGHAAVTWPTVPPAQICGNAGTLNGPATAPAGAITVPAGDNSALTPNYANPGFSVAGSTFWFAPGVHTLG